VAGLGPCHGAVASLRILRGCPADHLPLELRRAAISGRGGRNGVFFTALALIILQPIFFPGLISETVTLELPNKVNIH
jgi:hypothetical protein